jgi:O-antigen/teichoic acid export membrane protein
MSVLILPVAVVVALFSKEILLLWTQNPTTADKAHLLVTILVIGTLLNGLMHIPYDLQLAHGWTKLAFYSNLISAALLVPLIVVLTNRYAALGGASVWVILNSGYVLVNIQIMHKRILPGEKRKWYIKDVGMPLVAALVTASIGRLVFLNSSAQPIILMSLIISSIVTQFITALATPTVRSWVLGQIYKVRVAYGS